MMPRDAVHAAKNRDRAATMLSRFGQFWYYCSVSGINDAI